MQLRIRTIQVLIALLAPPIGLLCEGAKDGCAALVLVVWGALVAAPLLVMALVLARVKRENAREQVIGVLGAIAVVGYSLAIFVSFAMVLHFSEPIL
jgi:hypothetical protein